jgi:hypothetical protein
LVSQLLQELIAGEDTVTLQLKIDWSQIDLEQFRRGLEVELEHGAIHPETNVTGDDPMLTEKTPGRT